MRRVIPVLLGGLFLAALASGPAQAATGMIVIDGATYENPSGCIAFGDATIPQAIANNTNVTVSVYSATDCTGVRKGKVPPGGSGTFEAGSVKVG